MLDFIVHLPLLPSILAFALLTSACGGPPGGERPGPSPERQHPLPLLNTPTGEPLGRANCVHATAAWFARSDADRDGWLSPAEFSADARAVFARLDGDNDGVVSPDELQRARMPFQDQDGDQDRPQRRRSGPMGGGRPPGGGGMGGEAERREGISGSGGSAGALDPVMTADSNLDFKVSRAEFAARTDENFATLDKNADHRLSMDDVAASCPSQSAAPSRR